MGLVEEQTVGRGILGLDLRLGQTRALERLQFSTFVKAMKEQLYIKQLFFSMWLNDLESSSGHITFGSVDRNRFEGRPTIVPILSAEEGLFSRYLVPLTGVGFLDDSRSQTFMAGETANPSFLDSGATEMALPSNVFNGLAKKINA